jgi:hypothetical protein
MELKERVLLRFDTVVAVCALLASSVAAAAMVYQTRVIEQQFAATVWPYLSVDTDNTANSVMVRLTNDGAGPALIRSAQLVIDGKPVPGWTTLLEAVFKSDRLKGKHHATLSSQSSSVDASATVRSGDSKVLFGLRATDPAIIAAARAHRVALNVCYCSINNSCWQLHDELGSGTPDIPKAIGACAIGPSIEPAPLNPALL